MFGKRNGVKDMYKVTEIVSDLWHEINNKAGYTGLDALGNTRPVWSRTTSTTLKYYASFDPHFEGNNVFWITNWWRICGQKLKNFF